MANNGRLKILDQSGIHDRLKRMAYQIYEAFYNIEKLYVIGISERGGFVAEELSMLLAEISELEIVLIEADLDRESDPVSYGMELSLDLESLKDQHLLVVDDVLYSGRTLLSVVSILLQAGPRLMKTAVLIDRGHRNLPISADITGLELATTLQQHVHVDINREKRVVEAFLE